MVFSPCLGSSYSAAVLRSTLVLWWCSRPLGSSYSAAVLRSTLVLWWCSRPPWARRLLWCITVLLQCYAQRWCCGGVLALSGLVIFCCSAPLNAGAVVVFSPSLGSSYSAAVLRSTLVLSWCSRPVWARHIRLQCPAQRWCCGGVCQAGGMAAGVVGSGGIPRVF